ncbi:MAG TPA: 30S ribosomal protein S17 [Candidatus Babeliales bacterium]|nr:30S ribosomal protein S17 [Candidatus Babeliales bacterium]
MTTKVAETEQKRLLSGKVVSDKMNKSIVVSIERSKKHPITKKVIRTHKKYKVHDAKDEARVGDMVEVYEGRPVSKQKFMYLHKVVNKNSLK